VHLYISCSYQIQQKLFPYTALINWRLYWWPSVFCETGVDLQIRSNELKPHYPYTNSPIYTYTIVNMYLYIHRFSHPIQQTIHPFTCPSNHHSIRPTAAEPADNKAHNCIGSWLTSIHFPSLDIYLMFYLMLTIHTFLGLRDGPISRTVFPKINSAVLIRPYMINPQPID
jgi:hypothetical protein